MVVQCCVRDDGVEAARRRDDLGEYVTVEPGHRDVGKPRSCPIQDRLIERPGPRREIPAVDSRAAKKPSPQPTSRTLLAVDGTRASSVPS